MKKLTSFGDLKESRKISTLQGSDRTCKDLFIKIIHLHNNEKYEVSLPLIHNKNKHVGDQHNLVKTGLIMLGKRFTISAEDLLKSNDIIDSVRFTRFIRTGFPQTPHTVR